MTSIADLGVSTPTLLIAAGVAALVLRFNRPIARAHLALFRRAGSSPRGLGLVLRMLWAVAAAAVLVLAVVGLVGALV